MTASRGDSSTRGGPGDRGDPEQFRRVRHAMFARHGTLDPADVPTAERVLGSLHGSSPRFRLLLLLSIAFFGWMCFRTGFGSHRHGHWVLFAMGASFVLLGVVALAVNVVTTRRLRRAIARARRPAGADGP